MNKEQKEVQQAFLDNEKAVLKLLEENYNQALTDINEKLANLLGRADSDLQHVIYQVEYQNALKTQIKAILEQLQNNNFESISEYLTTSYEDGFIGTMYDLQNQGIPLAFPIDQKQVAEAIRHETKLSTNLYTALGKDVNVLQKQIASEISRGISTNKMYADMAKNISNRAGISRNNAMRIARTEGHRIQNKATADAQFKAKEKGADVVKQWDSTLDSRTRKSHRKLDGQIRELEDPFTVGRHKAMRPGDFGVAGEDINCRCALLQRARWALEDDIEVTKYSEDAPVKISENGTTQYIDMSDAKDYKDFKKKYKQYQERVRSSEQKINEDKGQKKAVDVVQSLKDKGIEINIEVEKEEYREKALESLEHIDRLTNEYRSTTVSYSVKKTNVTTEGGSAYMLDGRTAITVSPISFKKRKATDSLKLGDNQPFGTTYHEFAHSLSQSKEKIDKDFWKEIRKLKKEYEANRGNSNWFDIKISDYASKDIDEFIAEGFAQAKLSDNPSPYSKRVLEIIDKYFKN